MLKKSATLLSLLCLFGFVLIATACNQPEQADENNGTENEVAVAETTEAVEEIGAVGSTVVDFELTTYEGEQLTAANLDGKVTMLIFWFPT